MPSLTRTAPARRAQRWPSSSRAQDALLERAIAPIRSELAAVTERLLAELRDPVAGMVVYLITAGGKRLRPALVLLSGALGSTPNRSGLIDAAAAVELIHTATLIHDDIIDQSPLRRSQPTFHERWGVERAVLMGDYLYATAFTMLARLAQPQVMQVMADVCQQLSRGELREVEARYRMDLTEAEYLDIIRDKTASLISGCCRCGAILAGLSADAIERVGLFGLNFGLAFQMVDDCLDLLGDQERLGKAIHADVDKGALSLPMVYLAQALSPTERERLFAPLASRATDPTVLARIAKAAAACGAITKAQRKAHEVIRQASAALAGVPMNGIASSYERLTAYAVTRRS